MSANICHWRQDEGGHIRETLAGVVEALTGHERIRVLATDFRWVYRAAVDGDGELQLTRLRPAWSLLRTRIDVAWVQWVFPAVPNLLCALVFRALGARVWCSPMSSLGSDFARISWFRDAGPLWRFLRPKLLKALRACWKLVATDFVCLSSEEVRLVPPPSDDRRSVAGAIPGLTQGGSTAMMAQTLALLRQRASVLGRLPFVAE